MTRKSAGQDKAGLAGPVAVWGGALLLAFAPLVRGGDYFIALIPLEVIGLAIFVALGARAPFADADAFEGRRFDILAALVLASPLLIALVQLVPLPASTWSSLPGHARFAEALEAMGLAAGKPRPITISPDATRASLLAGIPLVAAFLLGYLATVRQYRLMLRVAAAVAFAEVVLALLQLSGGERSPFYFGMLTYGMPIGSMGTRNELANLLAMSLAGYVWLAYDDVRYSMRFQPGAPLTQGRFDDRHAMAAWVAGGLVIVVGILITRSRAGALFGLGCAALAVATAALRVFGWSRGWRFALPVAIVVIAGAVGMVGLETIIGRIGNGALLTSAGFRGELWRTSWLAGVDYFPWGSGWGTYDIAYRPFQPPLIAGYPNHAHMDYLEMFVEGGALFLMFAACAAWLLARRGAWLFAQAARERTLDRESMMAAISGIGLLGFMLHAGVDFVMRVPANAILGALLAGAFLRPLPPAKKPVVQ